MAPDWIRQKLGDFTRRIKRINVAGEELPPLSITKDRGIMLQSDKFKKRIATDLRKYLVVRKGEFAFDPMSLYYGAVGRIDVVNQGVISPDYVAFEADDSVDHAFLDYLLRSSAMHKKYETVAEGGNQFGKRRRVYWSVFTDIEVTLPSLSEQRKIASILSSVDDTIEKTLAVITQLEVVKAEALTELLSRGIPERHAKYKTTQLGQLPEPWECVPLASAIEGIDAGWSPLCDTQPAQPGEWGVLKVSSVTWGEFRPKENKKLPATMTPRPETEVHDGDLLVSRANTKELVGRSVLVKSTPPHLMASDKLLRLRANPQRATAAFLNYALATDASRRQIEDAATGSSGSMKNISQEKLRSILIPLPSLDEQKAIVAFLDATVERIQKERATLDGLHHLKAALLHMLLSGEVRVTHSSQEAA